MRTNMVTGESPLALLAIVVAGLSEVASLYALGFQRLTREVSIVRSVRRLSGRGCR